MRLGFELIDYATRDFDCIYCILVIEHLLREFILPFIPCDSSRSKETNAGPILSVKLASSHYPDPDL